MKYFDEAQTLEALPFGSLIARLHEMFRAGCNVPARHVHRVESPSAAGTVLIMPAWTDLYLGIKTVNIYPGNRERGLPGLFSVYTLFDARTGQPIAQMDGDVITSRRTAAASALAASFLARKSSRSLLVVGAGRVASLLPAAYSEVFALESVQIWARNAVSAEALAGSLREQGVPAQSARDLQAAVERSDLVSCATLATAPLLQGKWLRDGAHVDLIGSFTPEMREADDDVFRDASIFVDKEEALHKSGELLGPMSRGIFDASDVVGTLQQLCSGQIAGRRGDSERSVFKSVGTALEDLAAAIAVYEFWAAHPMK